MYIGCLCCEQPGKGEHTQVDEGVQVSCDFIKNDTITEQSLTTFFHFNPNSKKQADLEASLTYADGQPLKDKLWVKPASQNSVSWVEPHIADVGKWFMYG